MQEWILLLQKLVQDLENSKLLNQKNPLLHYIFQTANLYSCIFMFPGGKLQGTTLLVVPRLTTDWDSDIAGGFLFGWYPLSDA